MKNFDIPECINDKFIIQFFTLKDNINPSRTKEQFIERFETIKNYLINRYNDSDSYLETIYRIINNIENKPTCLNCHKPLQFHHHHFRQYCSQKCIQNDELIKQKKVKTMSKHNITYNDILEKRNETCLKKFGTKHPSQLENIKEKVKQTNIKRFGVPYTAQSKTCLEKMKQTCLMKYGVEYNLQIPEIKKQVYETKKKNHTFNSSKVEILFTDYLIDKFDNNDIETQYYSNKYPFNCDFFIKSLNLYIEIQGFWTHGKHPFDETNIDDISKKNELIEKSIVSKSYKNALETWAIRDVKKRNIAKENKLNYLEIFSSDITEVINIFEEYILNDKFYK